MYKVNMLNVFQSVCSSATECYDVLFGEDQRLPDLVLLDCIMPHESGFRGAHTPAQTCAHRQNARTYEEHEYMKNQACSQALDLKNFTELWIWIFF